MTTRRWARSTRQHVVVRDLAARAQAAVDDVEGLCRHRVPERVRIAPGVAAEAPRDPRRRTDRVPAEQPVAQRRETSNWRGSVQRREARSDGGRVSPRTFRSFAVAVRRGTHRPSKSTRFVPLVPRAVEVPRVLLQ